MGPPTGISGAIEASWNVPAACARFRPVAGPFLTGRLSLLSRTNLGRNAVVAGVSRLLPSTRTRREEATDAGTTVGQLDVRTAVLGVGALTAGYLVGRRLPSAAGASSGDLRERAGDALPGDGVDVPIGGTDAEGGGAEADDETEVAGTDPSLEEVDERTGQPRAEDDAGASTTRIDEDVDEEPAEPGEMQVDEEVVEEVADADAAGEEDAADEE